MQPGTVDAKVLSKLASGEVTRFSELKKAVGTVDKVLWESLLKLSEKGLIEKAGRGLYKITATGAEEEKRLRLKEADSLAHPIEINIGDAIYERAKKTISYMEPRLLVKEPGFMRKLEALAKYYGTVTSLGFYKPFSEQTREIASQLSSSVRSSALYPPTEEENERKAFEDAFLAFLNYIFRCRSLRAKVAKERRLTVVLDLNFSNVPLADKELDEAMFWAFVFEGLHREGKI
ncbi:MAG: hypothetical protein QW674_03200 [Candidatus Bathyarchaeia archaeon]